MLYYKFNFYPFPCFLSIETTETEKNKKGGNVYLLLVTLWLFYAPTNLTTIFNFFHLLH
jgi:hypothetical protein